MASEPAHLSAAALALLQGSKQERLWFVREDHFVDYQASENILRELTDVANYPKTTRPPCRAVIGSSSNGKTTLTRELMRRHPVVIDQAGYPIAKIVWMEMPPEPDEGRFFSACLTAMSVTHRADAPPERLELLAEEALLERRTGVLVIDEFHAMLNGSPARQKAAMAAIKRFANTRQLSVIACGTEQVSRALATDTQFVTRFQRIAIPLWQADENFLRLLASFESLLPLAKPSNLHAPEPALLIFRSSDKTIGSISGIVRMAAEMALEAGEERISFKRLEQACRELLARKLF